MRVNVDDAKDEDRGDKDDEEKDGDGKKAKSKGKGKQKNKKERGDRPRLPYDDGMERGKRIGHAQGYKEGYTAGYGDGYDGKKKAPVDIENKESYNAGGNEGAKDGDKDGARDGRNGGSAKGANDEEYDNEIKSDIQLLAENAYKKKKKERKKQRILQNQDYERGYEEYYKERYTDSYSGKYKDGYDEGFGEAHPDDGEDAGPEEKAAVAKDKKGAGEEKVDEEDSEFDGVYTLEYYHGDKAVYLRMALLLALDRPATLNVDPTKKDEEIRIFTAERTEGRRGVVPIEIDMARAAPPARPEWTSALREAKHVDTLRRAIASLFVAPPALS